MHPPLRVPCCKVAFLHKGRPHYSTHFACPFGSAASVHSWERLGALINKVVSATGEPVLLGLTPCACQVRVLLRIPAMRYVDDFFGAERPGCVEHALSCIERVAKLMLGSDAVAADKCEWGTSLTILGVDVAPQA